MAETKRHAGIFFIGTNAERVGYSTTGLQQGAMWMESDTDAIYIWDGTIWQEIGSDALAGVFLELDCSNDPLTSGLEINTAAAVVGLIVQGDAAQAANLQEWQNNAAANLAEVDPDGQFGIGIDPTVVLDVYKDSPSANEVIFRAASSNNTDGVRMDEDGDIDISGNTIKLGSPRT